MQEIYHLVAGGGFEPPTSWLWAKRADRTALSRDIN